jgi:hypothetical protein
MNACTWLLVLADVLWLAWAVWQGATARRRARELAERETVAEGWATALYRREMELHSREYRLLHERDQRRWLP